MRKESIKNNQEDNEREMSDAKRRYYTRKRKHRRRRFKIISLLVILLLVSASIIAIVTFCDTQIINASGSKIYSAEQIIKASKIEIGKSLFAFNKNTAEKNIQTALPYIGQVEVKRKLFTKVEIEVVDTKADYIGENKGKYYYINRLGKVLGECSDKEQTDSALRVPVVYGLYMSNVKIGYVPTFENSVIIDNLKGAFEFFELDKNGFIINPTDVRYIDLYQDYQIKFWYKDYLLINMGTPEDLPKKKDALRQIIEKTAASELAEIDLSLLTTNKEAYRNSVIELEIPVDSIEYEKQRAAASADASGESTGEISGDTSVDASGEN